MKAYALDLREWEVKLASSSESTGCDRLQTALLSGA